MEELSWRVGMGPDQKGRKYRLYPVDVGRHWQFLIRKVRRLNEVVDAGGQV